MHTTVDGGKVMAEALDPFLLDFLDRRPSLARRTLPRSQWRRGVMDTTQALKDWPRERFDCLDLPLDYARLEGAVSTLELGRSIRAQGLVHLFHPAGGKIAVTPDPPGVEVQLNTIDALSYFPRIGVLPFDFFRGADIRRLAISPPEPANDVTLKKGERTTPLRTYIGPVLTLEPAKG